MIKLFFQQQKIGQYHKGRCKWVVEFNEESDVEFVNPTTGSVGGTSLSTKHSIIFNTKELAIKYLSDKRLNYKLIEDPKVQSLFFNSYAKNFI